MVEGEVQLLEDHRQTLPEELEDLKDLGSWLSALGNLRRSCRTV